MSNDMEAAINAGIKKHHHDEWRGEEPAYTNGFNDGAEWQASQAHAKQVEQGGCVGDEDLNARLKAKGMFTIEEMLDDDASGLGMFDTHIGVNTFDDLAYWVDRKREEYLRMRIRYEIGDKEKDDLYEWVFAHGAAFTCISKHLRRVLATPKD